MTEEQINNMCGGDPLLEALAKKIHSRKPNDSESRVPAKEANNILRLAGVEPMPEDIVVDTMAELNWDAGQMDEFLKARFPSINLGPIDEDLFEE